MSNCHPLSLTWSDFFQSSQTIGLFWLPTLPQRPGLEEWDFRWLLTLLLSHTLLLTNTIVYKFVRIFCGLQSLVSLCLLWVHTCVSSYAHPKQNKNKTKTEILKMKASESPAARGMWLFTCGCRFILSRETKIYRTKCCLRDTNM